jgi:hypothetical protein
MAQETTWIDNIRSIEHPVKGARAKDSNIRLTFVGGATARLDGSKARDRTWAEVLQSLEARRQPAYIEVDPKTRFVTALLLPLPFLVKRVHELQEGGDLEVELEVSHAKHYLRRGHPNFETLRKILERARRDEVLLQRRAYLGNTCRRDLIPTSGVRCARESPSFYAVPSKFDLNPIAAHM